MFLIIYRSSVPETTKITPSEVEHGRKQRLPFDLKFGRLGQADTVLDECPSPAITENTLQSEDQLSWVPRPCMVLQPEAEATVRLGWTVYTVLKKINDNGDKGREWSDTGITESTFWRALKQYFNYVGT